MTTYIKRLPAGAGALFFGVAAFTAIYSGASVIDAIIRGSIAGAVAAIFMGLIGYVIFEEEIPEIEIPEGYEKIGKKFKREE